MRISLQIVSADGLGNYKDCTNTHRGSFRSAKSHADRRATLALTDNYFYIALRPIR